MTTPPPEESEHIVTTPPSHHREDSPTNYPPKDHPEAPLGIEGGLVVPPTNKTQHVPPDDPFSRFWSGKTVDTSNKNKGRHRWLTRKPEHRHSIDTAELERQVPRPYRPKFYSRYPNEKLNMWGSFYNT